MAVSPYDAVDFKSTRPYKGMFSGKPLLIILIIPEQMYQIKSFYSLGRQIAKGFR